MSRTSALTTISNIVAGFAFPELFLFDTGVSPAALHFARNPPF
jgi:hypothetical protein